MKSFIDVRPDISPSRCSLFRIVFVKSFSGSSFLNFHFQVNSNVCFVQKTIHIIRWSMMYSYYGKSQKKKKKIFSRKNRCFMRKWEYVLLYSEKTPSVLSAMRPIFSCLLFYIIKKSFQFHSRLNTVTNCARMMSKMSFSGMYFKLFWRFCCQILGLEIF